MTSPLETIVVEPAAPANAVVIWMHGLGADGHDFEPVVPEFDLRPSQSVRFIFPHAPYRPITINGGHVMRGWYDITELSSLRQEDATGIQASARAIEALIAQQIASGIPAQRIVLAGFSQGAAMALHTALRYAQPLAGVIALSGVSTPRGHVGGRSAQSQCAHADFSRARKSGQCGAAASGRQYPCGAGAQ